MVYGDSCKILDNEDSWIFVELNDGYQGWVKNFYGFKSESKKNHSHILLHFLMKMVSLTLSIHLVQN